MLDYCLPGVSFTVINYFLVSPPLISLPSDFVSSEWLNLVYLVPLEPGALAPLHPGYKDRERERDKERGREKRGGQVRE